METRRRFQERTTLVDMGAAGNNCAAPEFNESFISAASLPATCQILIQPLELSAVSRVSRFRFNPTDGVCNLSLYLVGFCNQSASFFFFFFLWGGGGGGGIQRSSCSNHRRRRRPSREKIVLFGLCSTESRIKTNSNEDLNGFTCGLVNKCDLHCSVQAAVTLSEV